MRRALACWGIWAVPPAGRDQRRGDGRHVQFNRGAYRERNRVQRMINHLKQHRRIASRYDKRAGHYAAMRSVAATLLWP